ncbi:hypothetical protein [Myroides odoratus]|uniref:hypothetical protein n=1 Tax=Myroides odoratus TaxID=256 RepID=UPI0007660564|nr:hypothetical protein [Myroides odoratus]
MKEIENIKVTELIEFNRRADGKNKNKFAQKLKTREKKHIEVKEENNSKGGGDYWISSQSCVLNVFKTENKGLYDSKISELSSKLNECKLKNTRTNLDRNIQILENFKDFDLGELRPDSSLKYNVPIKKKIKTFIYKELPIYLAPSSFYSYKKNNKDYLGALWLVSKKDGYKKAELGVFCELLYFLIEQEYKDKYCFEKEYCCVVDMWNAYSVSYNDIVEQKIPQLLDSIITRIKEVKNE